MKNRIPVRQLLGATVIAGAIGGVAFMAGRHPVEAQAAPWRFHLIEATISDVHRAIRERQITCRGLIQAYVNRAKAYNGVAHQLVTLDGAPIPPAPGVVRAGSPLKFPTGTIKASTILPHLDEWTRLRREAELTGLVDVGSFVYKQANTSHRIPVPGIRSNADGGPW